MTQYLVEGEYPSVRKEKVIRIVNAYTEAGAIECYKSYFPEAINVVAHKELTYINSLEGIY